MKIYDGSGSGPIPISGRYHKAENEKINACIIFGSRWVLTWAEITWERWLFAKNFNCLKILCVIWPVKHKIAETLHFSITRPGMESQGLSISGLAILLTNWVNLNLKSDLCCSAPFFKDLGPSVTNMSLPSLKLENFSVHISTWFLSPSTRTLFNAKHA